MHVCGKNTCYTAQRKFCCLAKKTAVKSELVSSIQYALHRQKGEYLFSLGSGVDYAKHALESAPDWEGQLPQHQTNKRKHSLALLRCTCCGTSISLTAEKMKRFPPFPRAFFSPTQCGKPRAADKSVLRQMFAECEHQSLVPPP